MKLDKIKVIAFDAYGTLCFIANKTYPFRDVIYNSFKSRDELSRYLMTKEFNLNEFSQFLNISAIEKTEEIGNKITKEVNSAKIYDEIIPTLKALKNYSYNIGLISNLAEPYAAPIKNSLIEYVDHFIFSYQVGFLKPDPKIFHCLCEKFNVCPENVLMVGDSIKSDINGANYSGMKSILIDRLNKHRNYFGEKITNLTELLDYLG